MMAYYCSYLFGERFNFITSNLTYMKKLFLIWTLLGMSLICSLAQEMRPVDYVDPFIGTEGGGNVFPGACLPFGMVKLGPDCGDLTSNSGYTSDGEIIGFSHIHVSGTGGGPKYGNVLIMPVTGEVKVAQYGSARSNEQASAGYYTTMLTKYNVKAELTATHSVGIHQYTFPAGKSSVIIDLGSFLKTLYCTDCDELQKLVGTEVEIVSDTLIEGYTRVRHGWNEAEAYTVYFSALFDTPADEYGTWKNGKLKHGSKGEYDSGENTGAYFTFNTTANQVVRVKVGVSFTGRMKARQNVFRETQGWDFAAVRKAASDRWNGYLSSIKVETASTDLKRMFYTALYHTMLMPTDRTGENPLWKSEAPYYDDFYAIWDTYRATNPLLTIIAPDKQVEIVRSLIDIYEHEKFMPDARSGNETGRTQGGSNCDVLIADAYVKGLSGIDYNKGLESMLTNAEKDPGADARAKGRGGITDYNKLGYVSTSYERAGSRTVEYAYNDFCIAEVAKGLGKDSISHQYYSRSGNWRNLWKPINNHGSKGFIMPRKADGSWDDDYKGRNWEWQRGWHDVYPFTTLTSGSWPDFFYEANSWEYSLYVPQDVEGLVESCGGKEDFIARLDTFFVNGYFNIGNEPSFLTPCLYNYVGRPDRTADRVRTAINKNYNATKTGLPGNDDSGSMSAWFDFHSMGFFPNAGQDIYLIGAPMFEKVTINLSNGKQFIIKTFKLSEKNKYIISAKLNGKPFNQSWFRHQDILNGGTLEFTMGPNPSGWGKDNLPPTGFSVQKEINEMKK
jgi:predicted alpha-1,2-mannosidase